MSALVAEALAVERGGVRVAGPLSAALQPGAITAICGPNGAGKSSLIMALAGLIAPAKGAVRIGDTDLEALSPKERARALGYLPQGSDIAWDLAVETLVALGRLAHGDGGRGKGREVVAAALEATGMERLAKRPVSRLSGGERARALLARVLAGQPQWVLADEPLAALDLAHQLRLVAHLKDCARDGQGVVIVLHDLSLAMNHADDVLVLSDGELIAHGPPQEALAPSVVEQGWGVKARWIGDAGARALVTQN